VKRRVFLSYSSPQSVAATRVELALSAAGYDVFRDRSDLQPGEAFDAKLRAAIRASDVFVFLISPDSVAPGRYTRTELKFAEQHWPTPSGHVLPVVVEPTPIASIPEYLKAVTLLEIQGDVAAEVAAAVQHMAPLRRLPISMVTAAVGMAVLAVAAASMAWIGIQRSRAAQERERRIETAVAEIRRESSAGNYADAWAAADRSLRSDGEAPALFDAQQKLAMQWLDDARGTESFSLKQIADTVYPALSRGVESASGARAADLLAHMGWADFLRSREGDAGRQPTAHYERAVALDPANPFAHAMWGFEILRTRGRLADANAHFGAALRSGREREFVRHLQLSALLWFHTTELEEEAIRVVNDMRRRGEKMPAGVTNRSDTSRMWDVYYARLVSAEEPSRFLAALPGLEHVATFKWLFPESEFPNRYLYFYVLARLEESAGQRQAAAAAYQATLRELDTRGETAGPLVSESRSALKRLAAVRR
jgi:tetratricopeptide (TPR) repeat protein